LRNGGLMEAPSREVSQQLAWEGTLNLRHTAQETSYDIYAGGFHWGKIDDWSTAAEGGVAFTAVGTWAVLQCFMRGAAKFSTVSGFSGQSNPIPALFFLKTYPFTLVVSGHP
jgi:hypothetical protein